MGLKQDIVVVNEFSVPTVDGGSRGNTPGDYVIRYMARNGATEDLTPVRYDDNDAYVTRYMARREATERYDSVGRIKQGMRDAQGLGGVAFGSTGDGDMGDISMSHRKVKAVSKDIQKQFESGKTVLKTVVSFDLPYLKRTGIVDEDFEPRRRGDYRGNIDQMKLRLAIMHGMDRMSRRFDDLEWVGVIQVDTMHVHCHLCMVDKGRGRVMPDGTQRGKLDEDDKRMLRRGIDMQLDEMQPVKMLASSVAYDRRNARCFIKKYTHQVMAQNGTPQLLMACLPDDRRLWRANTNRKEMRKANAITREFVEQVLAQPDSGYDKAMREIGDYARARQMREDLTGREYRELVANGRERLVTDCMNGVYSILKDVPESRMRTTTPMLDIMSMEYTDMAEDAMTDPMLEFGFRLRSYSSRLDYHKKEHKRYHDARVHYEEAEEAGEASEDSKPLYDFYKFEEEYNAMLMAKYQHFLAFLPPDEEYEGEFDDLMKYRDSIVNMDAMITDRSMRRRSPDSAEDYGMRVYGQRGGRFAVTAPQVLEQRLERMLATYDRKVDDFKLHLADLGMTFESDENGARVRHQPAYDFDDVKALDLHHLGYDFPFDAPVSKPNVDAFVRVANRRHEVFEAARAYLEDTGQGDFVRNMPEKDVQVMKGMADRFQSGQAVLPSAKTGSDGHAKVVHTTSLGDDFERDMKLAVQAIVQSVEFGS